MATDTSEQGLERLICTSLTGHPCDPSTEIMEQPEAGHDEAGWSGGNWRDYDREYCVDRHQLDSFLRTTQPKAAESLALGEDGPTRRKFLARLQGEITKRGTIDVLRHGIRHGAHDLTFFYGTPSPDNEQAKKRFAQNRFTITRQLRYSRDETQRALDIVLFINGLPIITFELKNNLTKQTVADAIEQYRNDRNPRERLFELGRCVAHFAADEAEARFCTHLEGKKSWFLPFNRGWNDGTGNPPNPDGLKTAYLWREVLTRESLTDILENYAQLVEIRDAQSGKKTRKQIWPRYHQVDVVRCLLAHAAEHGVGQCYLIQHSAGSGKSNSIAWLAHQLIRLEKDGNQIFDSIIVVTDRRILDRQINDTIRLTARIAATMGHAEHSGDLRRFIESGKKIIISTVQKFPFILDEIGNEQRGRRFAIIIDEAHSSQGGRTSAAMAQALSESGAEGRVETFEDRINRLMESRQLLPNASYFAFTATPKNKTLEIFGEPDPQPDGTVRHHAFHRYTMKQATEEGFILDVLSHYTPVTSYYKLAKTIENDPEFDASKARKKLRRFVEGHDHAIRLKAEIMVDHFHDQVLSHRKIGGQARAMVVTGGVERAIQYFNAIRNYLVHRKSPYQAIVAFSGEREFGGEKVSEASLNRFPSKDIEKVFRKHPYRILVCADKFQTGYDEPLLHTMYVDKILSGIQAVQTLSRLNRAHPKKHDVFVLDFQNDVETIHDAFTPFYRTTILSDETDPDKLHDLQADLDNAQVYTSDQV
ncbi:type I restriction endonuclease subunit R, partial [Candidatus Poribacteria bacterium]|nr:type I restriction endonuclease subunit R [Candidatus Poribacteria bacterium]